ncbi:type II toxin -antitoxin system TacA 1-like antitoxin [Lunatimonas lonarensis]|uniref:type II toxin -antitoxin system TacA 1-like antitoxin n=1 Tax=Lunatimonas lonarensis TaxID=1232681 RepID=UPI0009DBCC37
MQASVRIHVRVSKEQMELFRGASVISGFKNLTGFIVHCVSKVSTSLLMSESQLLKNEEDKRDCSFKCVC